MPLTATRAPALAATARAAAVLVFSAAMSIDVVAQVPPCAPPAEPSQGYAWIFVRVGQALRSLRYATDPQPIKRVGFDAGEMLERNVSAGACLAIQVPVAATTLYVRASGTNVDRGLMPLPTITRCRVTSPACALPLVPVSARRRVEVEAVAPLPAAVLERHGLDRSRFSGVGTLPRGRELDATADLSILPFAGSRDLFADTAIEDTDAAIEYWTPPHARYVVVPTQALAVDVPADWAVLRSSLTWFRSGSWLLGSEGDDPRDSIVAIACTGDGSCIAREVHGELNGVLIVDQEVVTLATPPSDLVPLPTDLQVAEREVSADPIVLRRGTSTVRGERTFDLRELAPEDLRPFPRGRIDLGPQDLDIAPQGRPHRPWGGIAPTREPGVPREP